MLNREIKIALGVGILMLAICLIIVLVQNKKEEEKNIKVEVYKLKAAEADEQRTYTACSISTEDAIKVNKEFKRALALRDNNSVTGKSITGNYKVIIDNQYIAFDNDSDKIIYSNKDNKLYKFSSDIYDIIINTCK